MHPVASVTKGTRASWGVLVVSLLITSIAWFASSQFVERIAKIRYTHTIEALNGRILTRMAAYEQVLRGGQGLFLGSEEVTRKGWKSYVSALRLEQNFPGFHGVGYAAYIRPSELESHVEKIRAEGFHDYDIKPQGARDEYTSIIYLEPFNKTNQRAFGYDMFSEQVRRAAMERARDTGQAALTGRVNLVQNATTAPLPAFLLYLPLYKTPDIPDTVEQRRKALRGYVYSPFFVHELMKGILQNQKPDVSFRVFDGITEQTSSLLYDGAAALKLSTENHNPKFSSSSIVELPGRQWLLKFDSTAAFDSDLDFNFPKGILLFGLVLSVLLFIIAKILTETRQRAFKLAERMTETLRKTESRLENLFEFAPDATVMVDERGVVVMVNQQAEKLFLWGRDELIGQLIEVLMPQGMRADHVGLRKKFMKSPSPRMMSDGRFSLYGLRKDGSTFPVEISLSPLSSGDGRMVVATVRDISERMQSEQAVREAMAMLDATEDGAFIFEPSTLVFSYVNEGAIEQLGYTRDELLSMTVEDILSAPDEIQIRELLEPMIRGESDAYRFVIQQRHKDGHDISLEINLQYVAPRGGEARFIALSRDVTEHQRVLSDLQRASQELREANLAIEQERVLLAQRVDERTAELSATNEKLEYAKREAEQASRAKSAFLASMSHEIRTPMNGVVGMVEVLLHSDLAEHQADAVKTMKESAFLLLRLIDDILDFSKIEAGKLELERTEVSVRDMVENICSSLNQVAAGKGVYLSVFVDPQTPGAIWSDAIRLRQVLYNLIGNAIKFSSGRIGQQGRVSVRVAFVETEGQQLIFTVSDNGIGMTKETKRNLFTSFSQAEVSTTRRFGGTGLGLAITKRLIELLGGTIRVVSAQNIGSTFSVMLPVEAVVGKEQCSVYDLSGLECILVTNRRWDMNDMASYLQHAGARTFQVDNLSDALRCAGERRLPIIISDAGQNKVSDSLKELHRIFVNTEVHHVLMTRGYRRYPRLESHDVVSIDGDTVRMESLQQAVAIAGGKATLEVLRGDIKEGLIFGNVSSTTVGEPRTQGGLILIAEDDAINQKVILRQLDLLGYAAEVAENGLVALKLWREGDYVLLLSDLHMPELDGYGLTKIIRQEEREHMPILALTANALRGEKHRAMEVGMDDYLTKPVQLAELAAALEKWIPAENKAGKIPRVLDKIVRNASKTVDQDVLKSLVGDATDILRELFSDYIVSARQLANELRRAYEAGDAMHVGAVAHKLKSSSRSVGALGFGDVCAELENVVKTKGCLYIAEDIRYFEETLIIVEAEINRILKDELK